MVLVSTFWISVAGTPDQNCVRALSQIMPGGKIPRMGAPRQP